MEYLVRSGKAEGVITSAIFISSLFVIFHVQMIDIHSSQWPGARVSHGRSLRTIKSTRLGFNFGADYEDLPQQQRSAWILIQIGDLCLNRKFAPGELVAGFGLALVPFLGVLGSICGLQHLAQLHSPYQTVTGG